MSLSKTLPLRVVYRKLKIQLLAFVNTFKELPFSQQVSVTILVLLLLILPLSLVLTLNRVKFFQRAYPATPPVTPPDTTIIPSSPTPTPAIYFGAYQLNLTNSQTNLTCLKGDPNCYYQTVLIAKNITSKPLYNTTIYTSSYPSEMVKYIGFDGNWTSGKSTTTAVVQPGAEAINTIVKAVPPAQTGEWIANWYIDAQTCNLNVSPPDCYYYGASLLTVKIKVVARPTPTLAPSATPSPSSAPTPTLAPSPTSLPTPTLALSPTPSPPPAVNSPPVITNRSDDLPKGRIFRKYSANLNGYDLNLEDELKMSVNNLPVGLSLGSCTSKIQGKRKTISCSVSGRPIIAGTYHPVVTLWDSKGGVERRTFNLAIENFWKWISFPRFKFPRI